MSFQNYVFTSSICAAPRLGWPHGEVECKNMGEVVQRMDCVDGEREREKVSNRGGSFDDFSKSLLQVHTIKEKYPMLRYRGGCDVPQRRLFVSLVALPL